MLEATLLSAVGLEATLLSAEVLSNGVSNWILANGIWNDTGFWHDDEFWTE